MAKKPVMKMREYEATTTTTLIRPNETIPAFFKEGDRVKVGPDYKMTNPYFKLISEWEVPVDVPEQPDKGDAPGPDDK